MADVSDIVNWKFSDQYKGYDWIKVKKYVVNANLSASEQLREFEKHHIEETTFLISTVRMLAKLVDEFSSEEDDIKLS